MYYVENLIPLQNDVELRYTCCSVTGRESPEPHFLAISTINNIGLATFWVFCAVNDPQPAHLTLLKAFL